MRRATRLVLVVTLSFAAAPSSHVWKIAKSPTS